MADDIVTKTKTYTDKVRTAVYGKEVRSSIADGIDGIAQNVKDEIARDELSNDVSSLKKIIKNYDENNLIISNMPNWDDGHFIDYTSGNKAANEDWSVCEYIPILSSTTYKITGFSNENIIINFKDKDGLWIQQGRIIKKTNNSFITPSNACEISLSVLKIDKFSICVKEAYKKSVITVGNDENCNYKTINEAINNANDTKENPVTVEIYPGTYNEVLYVKGERHLRFVGKNKKDCVIVNKSGKYINSPLRIAGDFLVENLTIIATADEADSNWTPTGFNQSESDYVKRMDFPSYCIHCDDTSDYDDKIKIGYIRNCILYSECLQAIGMGLSNNQYVIVEDCIIVKNTKRQDFLTDHDNFIASDYVGAFGCHSFVTSDASTEKNEHLIIKNCNIKSNDNYALRLYRYQVGSPMVVTAIGNTLEAKDGIKDVVKYIHGTKENILTKTSHGNNTDELNYGVINS